MCVCVWPSGCSSRSVLVRLSASSWQRLVSHWNMAALRPPSPPPWCPETRRRPEGNRKLSEVTFDLGSEPIPQNVYLHLGHITCLRVNISSLFKKLAVNVLSESTVIQNLDASFLLPQSHMVFWRSPQEPSSTEYPPEISSSGHLYWSERRNQSLTVLSIPGQKMKMQVFVCSY